MRTYGRVFNPDGTYAWTEVSTDANGHNDYVYITTLIQVLKLNLGESPFYANYGIPAAQAVLQQVAPDFFMAQVQQQFAPFFASLVLAKIAAYPPTYGINLVTQQGVKMALTIPV